MKSPDHDTPPITEEDLAPAEGPPPFAAGPFQQMSSVIRPSDGVLTSDPSAKLSYWNVRRSADQPPDVVGTLEEIETFRDQPEQVAARRIFEQTFAESLLGFDTSDPTRSPTGYQQTWKDRQRELDRKFAPSFTPRPMSRTQRRKAGDYRTARQIIADSTKD